MFASIPLLQKAMVSQSRWLRIAAVAAVAGTTVGFVETVSAGTLPAGTVEVAQASAHDAARCQELYSVWQRYKGVSTNGSGRDIQSQAALQDCSPAGAAAPERSDPCSSGHVLGLALTGLVRPREG
jgi:hypothetical protein